MDRGIQQPVLDKPGHTHAMTWRRSHEWGKGDAFYLENSRKGKMVLRKRIMPDLAHADRVPPNSPLNYPINYQ
jgi:hypothetical protein